MKPLKFETSEEFASTTKEFVSLLQTLTQAVTGVTQPHKDLFEINMVDRTSPFQQGVVYSVFRSAVTKEAVWCKGNLGKYPAKNIN